MKEATQPRAKDLESGIASIDEDHHQLFCLLDQATTAMTHNESADVIPNVLDRMIDHIHEHFRDEETRMRAMKFPGFETHRMEHAKFVQRALEFRAKCRNDSWLWTDEVLEYLERWVAEHIHGWDGEFRRFLCHPSGDDRADPHGTSSNVEPF